MNICILKLSSLGDICRALPAIFALRKNLPNANITWVVDKKYIKLLELSKININLYVFDKEHTLAQCFKMRKSLANKNFDILLNMQPTFRANIVSIFINAKQKIGFAKPVAKELHSLFNNTSIHTTIAHPTDNYLKLCQHLTSTKLSIKPTFLNISETALPDNITLSDNFFIINANTLADNRRNWQNKKFAEVINYCKKSLGLQAYLVGSNAKTAKNDANQICSFSEVSVINLVGRTTLCQLLYLIKKAKFIISVDSAPIHLADALGSPVIGIYGATNPITSGSYFYQKFTVNNYPPNLCHTNKRLSNPKHMSNITTHQVIQKINKILVEKNKIAQISV